MNLRRGIRIKYATFLPNSLSPVRLHFRLGYRLGANRAKSMRQGMAIRNVLKAVFGDRVDNECYRPPMDGIALNCAARWSRAALTICAICVAPATCCPFSTVLKFSANFEASPMIVLNRPPANGMFFNWSLIEDKSRPATAFMSHDRMWEKNPHIFSPADLLPPA